VVGPVKRFTLIVGHGTCTDLSEWDSTEEFEGSLWCDLSSLCCHRHCNRPIPKFILEFYSILETHYVVRWRYRYSTLCTPSICVWISEMGSIATRRTGSGVFNTSSYSRRGQRTRSTWLATT
jgi:hypothetical protein